MAASKTGMEKLQDAMPLEREFAIVMPADTTTEVGVEIDTDIAAGSLLAWAILGIRWALEIVAAPHVPHGIGVNAAPYVATLQLVRGALPATPVFIGRQDHDLIGEDIFEAQAASAVGFDYFTWPREVPFLGVTQMPKLHLTFGSSADMTNISAATNRIVGSVLYNIVSAPKARHEAM